MTIEIRGDDMNNKGAKVNDKLIELGKSIGLDEMTSMSAKRNVKNIIAIALITGLILILGAFTTMPILPGYFYGGGGIKDFKILMGGWLF
jgi:hypothetical protein